MQPRNTKTMNAQVKEFSHPYYAKEFYELEVQREFTSTRYDKAQFDLQLEEETVTVIAVFHVAGGQRAGAIVNFQLSRDRAPLRTLLVMTDKHTVRESDVRKAIERMVT